MAARGQFRPPYRTALALTVWAWENREYIKGRIAINGGDTDNLRLEEFLDIGYFLLVDSFMTGGLNYIAAKEAADSAISGVAGTPAPPAVAVEAQNQASLAQLESMMKGVK